MSTNTDFELVTRRHPWRWISSVLLFLIAVLFALQVAQNKTFHFLSIPRYLFAPRIMDGVSVTLYITFGAMIVGLVLGILLAIMRLSTNPVSKKVAGAFIWFFRGTPALVQLIFWFNIAIIFPAVSLGVPGMTPWFSVSTNTLVTGFVAALLGLGLNEAAYMAEIVRAGILSIDSGQREAAKALGFTPRVTMIKVILPQAFRVIVPPTGNQFISLLKASSLVSVIAAGDLLTQATRIYNENFRILELLVVASIWYLALTSIASIGQHYLERHLSRGFVPTRRTAKRSTKDIKAVENSATGAVQIRKEV